MLATPDTVVEWLEYPCYSSPGRAGMYPFPLAAEILKDPLHLDHGDLIVSREPGLGPAARGRGAAVGGGIGGLGGGFPDLRLVAARKGSFSTLTLGSSADG